MTYCTSANGGRHYSIVFHRVMINTEHHTVACSALTNRAVAIGPMPGTNVRMTSIGKQRHSHVQ